MALKISYEECPEISKAGRAFLDACADHSERIAVRDKVDSNTCVMIMHTTFLQSIALLIAHYNKSVLRAVKEGDKDIQGGEKHA